jgi:hypothetical protein
MSAVPLYTVCVSVRPIIFRPYGTTQFAMKGFSWNFYSKNFRKTVEKIQALLLHDKYNGNFYEDQYTFRITSRSLLLRMRNASDRFVQKVRTHIMQSIAFTKSQCLWDNVEKYYRIGQVTYGNWAHAYCMLDDQGYKRNPRICNNYCFPRQQGLHEGASILRYTYIACLVYQAMYPSFVNILKVN